MQIVRLEISRKNEQRTQIRKIENIKDKQMKARQDIYKGRAKTESKKNQIKEKLER